MEIRRNGSQPSNKGPADWFTGTVRIDPLFEVREYVVAGDRRIDRVDRDHRCAGSARHAGDTAEIGQPDGRAENRARRAHLDFSGRYRRSLITTRSIETRSLPTLTHCFPRSPAAAGSLIPFAPFVSDYSRLEGKPRRAKKLAAAFMNGPILVCFVTSMKQGQRQG